MRWGLWLSTFGYQRGWRHPSFCPGIFFGTPRLPPPRLRPRSKFGLRSSRFAKPFGPACGSLSQRAQRLGSGYKCAATANASLTYIPELYRLIRSLPLVSPFGLPSAVFRAAAQPPGSPACRYTAHSRKTPQSHRTSAQSRPSAYPKSPRSRKYFDLRPPSGAAPFGPTFGCSSYGLPSPPVPDPSIPDGNPCRPRATKQSAPAP